MLEIPSRHESIVPRKSSIVVGVISRTKVRRERATGNTHDVITRDWIIASLATH